MFSIINDQNKTTIDVGSGLVKMGVRFNKQQQAMLQGIERKNQYPESAFEDFLPD